MESPPNNISKRRTGMQAPTLWADVKAQVFASRASPPPHPFHMKFDVRGSFKTDHFVEGTISRTSNGSSCEKLPLNLQQISAPSLQPKRLLAATGNLCNLAWCFLTTPLCFLLGLVSKGNPREIQHIAGPPRLTCIYI